jgi:hypothetical protein
MDFLNRSAPQQPASRATTPSGATPVAAAHQPSNDKGGFKNPMNWSQPGWLRVAFVVLLFSAAGLAIAIALWLSNSSRPNENTYVNTAQYQAVFLTNGQVYFGKVNKITKTYVDLQDIYYLNSQQAAGTDTTAEKSTTPSSFSLVKLGCELHGPNDQMLINREQVTFWENLKADRQVAKAITQWQSENPNGQKCEDTAAAGTQQSTNAAAQTQSTTPAATSTTTKKP